MDSVKGTDKKKEVYNKFIKKMNGKTAPEVEREALNAIRNDLGEPSLEEEAQLKRAGSVKVVRVSSKDSFRTRFSKAIEILRVK